MSKTCEIPYINRTNISGCGVDCTDKMTCLNHPNSCYGPTPTEQSRNPTTNELIPWCYYKLPDHRPSCDIPYSQRVNVPGCDTSCGYENICLAKPSTGFSSASDAGICYEPSSESNVPWCYQAGVKYCGSSPSQTTNISVYNGTCSDVQVGGSGSCSNIMGNIIPQLKWGSSKGVSPGQTHKGPDYIQKWNLSNIPNRSVAVITPLGQQPQEGWPVVFMFEFMDKNGWAVGWGTKRISGGIAESYYDGSTFTDDDFTGQFSYMLYKRQIVHAGYAIICLSEGDYDEEMYLPCNSTNPSDMCWNGGNNIDANALRTLFDNLYNGTLIPGFVVNINKFAISGYSVGAQMVSRMINDFPTMKTWAGWNFPTIAAAIFIGGGSMHCYEFDKTPWTFKPCNSPSIGCCPTDQSEDNYDRGILPWSTHPPVMLLQGEQDIYAAWQAASNYFTVMNRNGVACYMIKGPYIKELQAGRHGIYDCQISPTIKFLKTYV